MRVQSVLRAWPLAAIWSVVCLILMIVGFAVLVPAPNPNDPFANLFATSDGDVAVMAFVLWLLGIAVLLAGVGVRRLRRGRHRVD